MTARELSDDDFDQDDQDHLAVRGGQSVRTSRALGFLCWALVVAALVFAVVRIFGLERTWLVTVVMAFTPYVSVLSLIPLGFAIALRRWRAAVVALVATFALVSVVVPRVVGSPDAARGPTLRVMSSNMYIGTADVQEILALATKNDIDVLALQEYTTPAQARFVAAGIDVLFPYSERVPRPGPDGSAIYSKYPLSATGFTELHWFEQAYATVQVPGALPVTITSVHPLAPASPAEFDAWAQSLAQQPKATPKGTVRLLIGDFNATLDFARLRTLLDSGYEDVADKLGDGLAPTWPYAGAKQAFVPKVTLDHVLVDPRIGISSYGTNRVQRTDHKSIHATLTLPRS